jgi:hypothetical protein
MALDRSGRPVDAVASNMGHLLATGLLDPDETAAVAARLASPEMSDAFGLRTMSSRSGGFGPLRYHCGTVWPHDTAIAVTGLRLPTAGTVGRRRTRGHSRTDPLSGRLPATGMVGRCGHRPHNGADRAGTRCPAGRLVLRPAGPSTVGALSVAGLTIAGERLDVTIDSAGRLESLVAPAGLTVEDHAVSQA